MNCCIWVYLGVFKQDRKDINWIEEMGVDDYPGYQLYISSFYFVITTITTVGYGDFRSFNTPERIFCCALMIFGVLAFSFSTGSLSALIN